MKSKTYEIEQIINLKQDLEVTIYHLDEDGYDQDDEIQKVVCIALIKNRDGHTNIEFMVINQTGEYLVTIEDYICEMTEHENDLNYEYRICHV